MRESGDRAWSELTAAEQDELIDQAAADEVEGEVVPVERVPAEQWAPTDGPDEVGDAFTGAADAYVEGVDAQPGEETP